jgi:hypothetical protein
MGRLPIKVQDISPVLEEWLQFQKREYTPQGAWKKLCERHNDCTPSQIELALVNAVLDNTQNMLNGIYAAIHDGVKE